jgi:hypothetical protein
MKYCLSFIFCISAIVTIGSPNYYVDRFSQQNPIDPRYVYSFPILNGGNLEICNKINSYLVKKELYLELGTEKFSIFEKVWKTEEMPNAVVLDLTYRIELLNEKIYSVSISGEGCGAYCEPFEVTYNFNLTTGNVVLLGDLFNKTGQQRMLKELNNHKKEKIVRKKEEIRSILSSDSLKFEDKEFYQDMLDLYTDCNYESLTLNPIRFICSDDFVKIILERCSAHYNRAVDELWEFEVQQNLMSLEDNLSEIGKELLMN